MEPCNPRATFHQVFIGLQELKRIFKMQLEQLGSQGYFLHDFGPTRISIDSIEGPVPPSIVEWSQEDLFAVIEFLHRHASKPIKHKSHRGERCGCQRSEFDREAGRARFRQVINRALGVYDRGFSLLLRGDIVAVRNEGALSESGAAGNETVMLPPRRGVSRVEALGVKREASESRRAILALPPQR